MRQVQKRTTSLRLAISLVMLAASPAFCHDVISTKLTWSREISRIFFRNCAQCHRAGGGAPMPLMKFDEVRPWAVAIKEEVLNRHMPPWNAVPGFGEFKHDLSLTQEEITRIAEWVEGGAPEGESQLLPAAPKFTAVPNAAASRYRRKTVAAGEILARPIAVAAVRAGQLKPGKPAKLMAQRPDGTIEPLLWIFRPEPKTGRTYEFTSPVLLPKGTKLLVSPANAGTFELLSN
jgi:hypothetical protein